MGFSCVLSTKNGGPAVRNSHKLYSSKSLSRQAFDFRQGIRAFTVEVNRDEIRAARLVAVSIFATAANRATRAGVLL